MTFSVSRRRVLQGSAVGVVSVALSGFAAQPASAAATSFDLARQRVRQRLGTGAVSANGWDIERAADIGGGIWTREIAGTGRSVALRIGEPQVVLGYVIRRFHYDVSSLLDGDVIGHLAPPTAGGALSNHASGTAVQLLPNQLPAGGTGNLTPAQRTAIRKIIQDCGGTVRWGGDFLVPHESFFCIAAGPESSALGLLAEAIATADATPGHGPGA